MSEERISPRERAEQLLANPQENGDGAPQASDVKVCLAVGSDGQFLLQWSAKNIGNYDWVGLYANPGDKDDDYIGTRVSGPWQWASKGTSYQTGEKVQANFQARYLVWNGSVYHSVARTPAFPGSVCST